MNLFVNYVPLSVADEALAERFSEFGGVVSVRIMRHLNTGVSKGYGFVAMKSAEDAAKAIEGLNGVGWETKRLLVKPANNAAPVEGAPTNKAKRSQKGEEVVDSSPVAAAAPSLQKVAAAAPAPESPKKSTIRKEAATHKLTADSMAVQHPIRPLPAATPSRSRTILISPVEVNCTVGQLASMFEYYGAIESASLQPYASSATITFTTPEAAANAARWLHGAVIPELGTSAPLFVQMSSAKQSPQPEVKRTERVVPVEAFKPRAAPTKVEFTENPLVLYSQGKIGRKAIAQKNVEAEAPQPVVAAPRPTLAAAPSVVAHTCPYCSEGTTVILHNMPMEEFQCSAALEHLLAPLGLLKYSESWGNGVAVATFVDRQAAVDAVALLGDGPEAVRFYDCSRQ